MLKIKLFPQGKKHQRSFKIVVNECRTKMNGKFIADLGFWYPFTKTVSIDQEKLKYWQKNGAQLTIGVDKLVHPEKHLPLKKTK